MSDLGEIRRIIIARPGPPGTGVSGPDWIQIRSDVDGLLDETYRGMPLQAGKALQVSVSGDSVGGAFLGGLNPTVSGLDTAVPHRIIARGRAKVTTVATKTLSMAVAVSGLGLIGTMDTTPSGGGTFWLKFYGSWDIGAGYASLQTLAYYETSDTTDATFLECEVDMIVIPKTD